MRSTPWKADLLLLTAAVIWGTAFVAQRVGMNHLGPMTFNGVRFALGGLALVAWRMVTTRQRGSAAPGLDGASVRWALAAGGVLFAGAALQQAGLVYTTAGKAGFITGLYVVLVPFLGFWLGPRPGVSAWVGAGLAGVGLYLLSVSGPLRLDRGDALVLVSAFFWAVHILMLSRLAPAMDPFALAAIQSLMCSGLSLGLALATESIRPAAIFAAGVPILYGGLLSVGVAYTLQVLAQKDAPPTHAAILLSLEAVFAAIAGWLLLRESMSVRSGVGCGLMLAGMLTSQLWKRRMLPPAVSSA